MDAHKPTTGEVMARTLLAPAAEVDQAAGAAAAAWGEWRRASSVERVQYRYALKGVLEENLDELTSTELFDPVLSLVRVRTVEDAIATVNRTGYGNAVDVGISVGGGRPHALVPVCRVGGKLLWRPARAGRGLSKVNTGKKVTVEAWARR